MTATVRQPLVDQPTIVFTAPQRTLAQRQRALVHANDIRSRRAQLKRDLKAGRQLIGEVLINPPAYLLTAKVFDMMLVLPKYGRVKVNRTLARAQVSPVKTFGGLSARQRADLADRLGGLS